MSFNSHSRDIDIFDKEAMSKLHTYHVENFNVYNKKGVARLATADEYELIDLAACNFEIHGAVLLGETKEGLFEFELKYWEGDGWTGILGEEEVRVQIGKSKRRITALVKATNEEERKHLQNLKRHYHYRVMYNDYKEYGLTFL